MTMAMAMFVATSVVSSSAIEIAKAMAAGKNLVMARDLTMVKG